ncbi:Atpalpha, partial [Symbiodinium sp. KB8]
DVELGSAGTKPAQAAGPSSDFQVDKSQLEVLAENRELPDLEAIGGVESLANKLHSNVHSGLTDAQVELNREKFGRNVMPDKPVKTLLQHFWESLDDLTLAILQVAGVVSIIFGVAISKANGDWFQGVAILAAVIVVSGVTSFQNFTQDQQFAALSAVKEDRLVEVRRNGQDIDISIYDVVVGDLFRAKSGEVMPCDGVLVSGQNVKADESSMTGESKAVAKSPRFPFMVGGSKLVSGDGRLLVTTVGEDTSYGRIVKAIQNEPEKETPLQQKLERLAIQIGYVGFVFGALTTVVIIIAYFASGRSDTAGVDGQASIFIEMLRAIVLGITIVVVAVPEGLPLAVTISLAFSMKRMYSDKCLVRELAACETMGSATAICSDKTGTLTQNKMTFAELLFDKAIFRTEFVAPPDAAAIASGAKKYPDFDHEGSTFKLFHDAMCLNTTASFKPGSMFERDNVDRKVKHFLPFYSRSSHAESDVPVVQWHTQGDASESSIIKFAQYMYPGLYTPGNMPLSHEGITTLFDGDKMLEHRANFPQAPGGQIPFNSANKYHVKITKNEGNAEFPYTVWMKGAPERIMTRCDHFVHKGAAVPMTDADRSEIDALQLELMQQGRRVLAFAKYDIPADMVLPEEYQVEKSIKEPKLGADGEPELKKGEVQMQSVRRRCPFNLDLAVRNVPLGDPAENDDGTGRDQLIAKWKESHVVEGSAAAGSDDVTVLSQAEYDAQVKAMENSKIKLTLIGMSALIDPPRPSVPEAVLDCQRAGVRVVMVTGDHPQTAAAIAKMVNIFSGPFKTIGPVKDGVDPLETDAQGNDVRAVRSIVVPGWELNVDTPDEKWAYIFAHDEIVFARTSPQQKLQIVKRFQDMESEIVAVTGDGVNDAPALKAADIGVAMGIAGTEVSKGAADMILMDDNFASIVRGVREGRLIFDNLKKSIAYTLSSNIPEIAPFLVFITVQTPLPLSTVLILAIDLGTDMSPEADIMRRPARDAAVDRLVTKKLVSFAYLQIGIIQAVAGFFTWIVVLNDYGYPPHILPGLGSFDNW